MSNSRITIKDLEKRRPPDWKPAHQRVDQGDSQWEIYHGATKVADVWKEGARGWNYALEGSAAGHGYMDVDSLREAMQQIADAINLKNAPPRPLPMPPRKRS